MDLRWGATDGEFEDNDAENDDQLDEEWSEAAPRRRTRRRRVKKKRQSRVRRDKTDYTTLLPLKEEEPAPVRARDMPAMRYNDEEIQRKIDGYLESAREPSTKAEYRYYAKKFRLINRLPEWLGDQTLPPSHTLNTKNLLKFLGSMWEERKKKPAVEQSKKWLNYALGLHSRPSINKYNHM